MNPWHGRLVAYDCETTGTDVENDRIVTASIVLCGGGETTQTHTWLADPGIDIPAEATAVHGVTTEHAREHGKHAADVALAVIHTLEDEADGRPLIVANSRFDLTILDREARRHNVRPLDVDGLRVVDPMVIDRHLDRYRRGSRRLGALCELYGIGLDDAHDASADALAAARLAFLLCSRGEVIRRVRGPEEGRELARLKREWQEARGDLDRLHALQRAWAAEQADGLREHFVEKGDMEAAASVSTHWPMVPFEETVTA